MDGDEAMERRTFLATLAGGLLAVPLAAEAQPPGKEARIGVLWPGTSPLRPPRVEAFRQGLSESGYIEGQNVTVEFRYAEGRAERLPQLAAQLVQLNVQVIAAIGTQATSAAQRTATTIPIVALADELVRSGLVASLARPGGNTTGVQILAPEITAKRLEVLKQVLPMVSRVAVLSHLGESLSQLPPLEETARSLGVQLQVLEVRGEGDLESAFQAAKGGRAGAIQILASPLLFAYSKAIIGLAAKHRLPAIYEWREAVESRWPGVLWAEFIRDVAPDRARGGQSPEGCQTR
jgi:putative tryptophan/tyrosine transport system substrate-binding protein